MQWAVGCGVSIGLDRGEERGVGERTVRREVVPERCVRVRLPVCACMCVCVYVWACKFVYICMCVCVDVDTAICTSQNDWRQKSTALALAKETQKARDENPLKKVPNVPKVYPPS